MTQNASLAQFRSGFNSQNQQIPPEPLGSRRASGETRKRQLAASSERSPAPPLPVREEEQEATASLASAAGATQISTEVL